MKRIAIAWVLTTGLGCGGGGPGEAPFTIDGEPSCHEAITLPKSTCDPSVATFTLDSTNPWYPLIPGDRVVLEGMDGRDLERVERVVLEETRNIAGVDVHVLEHKEFINGEIYEIAMNFYVETTDGTVCYFGEDVEFYEGGELANTDGTWRVGVGGAIPGVIMPADPQVGHTYYQEVAPGAALDMGTVTSTTMSVEIDGTTYDVIQILDSNPIDDEDVCEAEEKLYARGIGEIQDDTLGFVEYTRAPAP